MSKVITIMFLLGVVSFFGSGPARADLVVRTQAEVAIELTGFAGLGEATIFKGELAADSRQLIDTAYQGLALLIFAGGQSYPLLLGEKDVAITISDPGKPPAFSDSQENDYFYARLAGSAAEPAAKHPFAELLFGARELLESSYSMKTVGELAAKKNEFHEFVRKNYQGLRQSDMLMRLIGQYFMMHEYVQYHVDGRPATDIKKRYNEAVLSGVTSWLDILSAYLPKPEILNYCVSLYYDRSMVSLASLIMEKYRDYAFCAGEQQKPVVFPGETKVTDRSGREKGTFADFNGKKVIALVAKDCPVSMVAAVSKARELSDQKGTVPLIVASVEKLSAPHLAMAKMVRGERMLFIDDEKWRKSFLPEKIRLPLFVEIEVKR